MPEERTQNLSAEPAAATSGPPDDGFASDLAGPTEVTPQAAPREPDKPAFDPSAIDWHRAKPEEIPTEYRPVQQLVKSHLAQQTRAEQENAALRQRLQALETQAQQAPETNQQIAQALERLAPQQDVYADLRGRLSPEEAPAIDIVREIVRREYQGVAPNIEPIQQQVNQVAQAMAYLLQHFQQQQVQSQAGDLQGAVSKYGEDRLRAIAPTLKGMLGVVNASTGRPFTVAEAADVLLSGSLAQAQGAQAKDETARATAKRQVASPPSVSASDGKAITDDELKAGLRELFGR